MKRGGRKGFVSDSLFFLCLCGSEGEQKVLFCEGDLPIAPTM